MKRVRAFGYRLGQIIDGDNKPVSDRALIEIVDADDPQVLLGEININIEIDNADEHARKIVQALSGRQ
jgi:hypothetical protein